MIKQMQKLMNFAFYSCKQASELIDRRSVEPLSSSERMRLAIHLSMCKKCPGYARHSEFVDLAIQRMIHDTVKNTGKKLDNEHRNAIIRKIKAETEK